MPPMSAGLTFAFFRTALVAAQVACHQSSGFCSDQPGLGEEIGCSAIGGGQDVAVFVADQGLGAAGADVDAEQVGDGEAWVGFLFPLLGPAGRGFEKPRGAAARAEIILRGAGRK